jgi:hypothetical protein
VTVVLRLPPEYFRFEEVIMQLKRYVVSALSAGIFLLSACNLAAVTPTPIFSPTVPASPTAVVFPSTATPLVFPSPTTTLQPTPTLTLFYDPTVTSTPGWMDCPLIITRNDTNAGDMIHVRRCEDNTEYDFGPFANGVYGVGPDGKFIIYVTDQGMVYAAKPGKQYLSVIVNLVREKFFVAINRRGIPRFDISFTGEAPYYKLVLKEKKYAQKRYYNLPVWLTE